MAKFQVNVKGVDHLYDVSEEEIDSFTNEVASAGFKPVEVQTYSVEVPNKNDPLNPFTTHDYQIPVGQETSFIEDVIKQGYEPYLKGGTPTQKITSTVAAKAGQSILKKAAGIGKEIKDYWTPKATDFKDTSANWVAKQLTKIGEEKEQEVIDASMGPMEAMSKLIADVTTAPQHNKVPTTATPAPKEDIPTDYRVTTDDFGVASGIDTTVRPNEEIFATGERQKLMEFKRGLLAKELRDSGIKDKKTLSKMVNEELPLTEEDTLIPFEEKIYKENQPAIAGWAKLPNESDDELRVRQTGLAEVQNLVNASRREYSLARGTADQDRKYKEMRDLEDQLPAFIREAELKEMEAVKLAEKLPAFVTMHSALGKDFLKGKVPEALRRSITTATTMGSIDFIGAPEGERIKSGLSGAAFGAALGATPASKIVGGTALTFINTLGRMSQGEDVGEAFQKGLVDTGFQMAIFGGIGKHPDDPSILKRAKFSIMKRGLMNPKGRGEGLTESDASWIADSVAKGTLSRKQASKLGGIVRRYKGFGLDDPQIKAVMQTTDALSSREARLKFLDVLGKAFSTEVVAEITGDPNLANDVVSTLFGKGLRGDVALKDLQKREGSSLINIARAFRGQGAPSSESGGSAQSSGPPVQGRSPLISTTPTPVQTRPEVPTRQESTTPRQDGVSALRGLQAREARLAKGVIPPKTLDATPTPAPKVETPTEDQALRVQLKSMLGKSGLKKAEAIAKKQDMDLGEVGNILDADPTPKKKYREWLIARHKDGGIRIDEDKEQLQERLQQFDDLSKKAIWTDEKDINKYKSYGQLAATVKKYTGEEGVGADIQERVRKAGDGAKIVVEPTEENPFGVVETSTPEACRVMGDGTEWCTTSKDMAEHYILGEKNNYLVDMRDTVYKDIVAAPNNFPNSTKAYLNVIETYNELLGKDFPAVLSDLNTMQGPVYQEAFDANVEELVEALKKDGFDVPDDVLDRGTDNKLYQVFDKDGQLFAQVDPKSGQTMNVNDQIIGVGETTPITWNDMYENMVNRLEDGSEIVAEFYANQDGKVDIDNPPDFTKLKSKLEKYYGNPVDNISDTIEEFKRDVRDTQTNLGLGAVIPKGDARLLIDSLKKAGITDFSEGSLFDIFASVATEGEILEHLNSIEPIYSTKGRDLISNATKLWDKVEGKAKDKLVEIARDAVVEGIKDGTIKTIVSDNKMEQTTLHFYEDGEMKGGQGITHHLRDMVKEALEAPAAIEAPVAEPDPLVTELEVPAEPTLKDSDKKLYDDLVQQFEDGDIDGTPSNTWIMHEYGVGRGRARRLLEQLKADGHIEELIQQDTLDESGSGTELGLSDTEAEEQRTYDPAPEIEPFQLDKTHPMENPSPTPEGWKLSKANDAGVFSVVLPDGTTLYGQGAYVYPLKGETLPESLQPAPSAISNPAEIVRPVEEIGQYEHLALKTFSDLVDKYVPSVLSAHSALFGYEPDTVADLIARRIAPEAPEEELAKMVEELLPYVERTAELMNVASPDGTIEGFEGERLYRTSHSSNSDLPLSNEKSTGKTVTLADISNAMTQAIDTVIRVGRVKAKAHGTFDPKSNVIRVAVANDLPTAGHELFHRLADYAQDRVVDLTKTPASVQAELLKLGKEMLEDTVAPPMFYMREAFAELMGARWMMGLNTDFAPETIAWFNGLWRKQNKGLHKRLSGVAEQIDTYSKMGSEKRIDEFQVTPRIMMSKLKTLTSQAKHWEDNWISSLAPLHRIERAAKKMGIDLPPSKSPAKVAEFFMQTHDARLSYMINDGMIDPWGNVTSGSLKNIFSTAKGFEEDFIRYVLAKHADEMHRQGLESGIAQTDIDHVLSEHAQGLDGKVATRAQAKKWEKIDRATRMLKQWTDGLLDYINSVAPSMLGEIGAERMKLKYEVYIPMLRIMEDIDSDAMADPLMRQFGFGSKPNNLKQLKGSGRRIANVVYGLIETARNVIRKSHERAILDAVVELADLPGFGKYIEEIPRDTVPMDHNTEDVIKKLEQAYVGEDGELPELDAAEFEETLTFFSRQVQPTSGGKPIISHFDNESKTIKWYEVHPDIFKALASNNIPAFSHPLMKLFVGLPRKSVQLGAVSLNTAFQYITNPTRDIQTQVLQTQAKAMIPEILGSWAYTFLLSANPLTVNKYLDWWNRIGGEMTNILRPESFHTRSIVKGLISGRKVLPVDMVEALYKIIQLPENVTRANELQLLMKEMGIDPKKHTFTPDEAIFFGLAAMRVSVNFKDMGDTARTINQWIPFFAAQIGGQREMARTIKTKPIRTFARGSMITMVAMALWMMNRDKDWYRRMSYRDRYRYMYIELPESEILKIATPHDYWHLFGSIPVSLMDRWHEDDPKAANEAIKNAFESASWFGSLDNPTLPPLFKVGVELYGNENLYNQRPIVPQGQVGLSNDMQVGTHTTKFAKDLNKAFPGLSPRKVDHTIRSLTGSTGGEMLRMLGLGSDQIKSTKPEDTPILGNMFLKGGTSHLKNKNIDEMYELKAEHDMASRTAKTKHYMGMSDEVYPYEEDQKLKLLNSATKMMGQYYELMSTAKSRVAQRSLADSMNGLADEIMGVYNSDDFITTLKATEWYKVINNVNAIDDRINKAVYDAQQMQDLLGRREN